MTIAVTYATDLDKVKRIVKQVGKELLADPELAPNILDTLKMQGVEEYGDFAIKIRLKLTTKPGEQFVIRRRAYALIKQAFDANGIKFAFPTVRVAGGWPRKSAGLAEAPYAPARKIATRSPTCAAGKAMRSPSRSSGVQSGPTTDTVSVGASPIARASASG